MHTALADNIGPGKIFECAMLINLTHRRDRYEHSMNEFRKIGITHHIECMPAIQHRFGMVGCSLSHLECVKEAKKRGAKSVLIFEDDIVVTPEFEKCVGPVLEQLNARDWAVFHFGAMLMNIAALESPNLLRIGYNWAAHAVAIHERAYDFIIKNYDPKYSETDNGKPWGGHYPFDGFINKEVFDAGFKIYSAYPLLMKQLPNMSDTWGYHRDYKDLLDDSYEKQIVRSEVNVVVCSKNRPMQLHALLQSFFTNLKDPIRPDVYVVYKADKEYLPGYERLTAMYRDVKFVHETDFVDEYKKLMTKSFTLYLVDDTVFFRPFKLSDGCVALASNPDVFSFSYRLGKNTTYSYINNIPFESPKEYETADPVICVDWTKQQEYIDFGYPFEISSSMYRTDDLSKIFSMLPPTVGPNYLELNGTIAVRKHREQFGHLIATYPHSVAVSIPLNRVQNLHLNRCATNPGYTSEELLKNFLNGLELDLSSMDSKWSTNSVHAELLLPFRSR